MREAGLEREARPLRRALPGLGELLVAAQARLVAPELSGRDGEMVLNSAYLVSDRPRFEGELTALARELSERGLELELTGPWPPYNFVSEELRA